MNPLRFSFLSLAFLFAVSAVAQQQPAARLDRTNLLQYRDVTGAVQPVKTKDDWLKRRAEILRGMQEVMGPLPGENRRVPLDLKIEEETDIAAEGYIRRKITYVADATERTPAYLCIPKSVLTGKAKAPAILCLHPTDNKFGNKVVVGLGGRENRQYAAELARRGYVTIAPAYPQLADYWPNLVRLGYESGTMKAIWDNIRALDLLASLPFVDTSRGFGAVGHSLGGHNSIYTAVFDERIKVISSSCGFDSYLNYYDGAEANWFFNRGWCQPRYMPRLSNYRGRLETIPYDFHELLGALAPRVFIVNAPIGDSNFRWKSVDDCAKAATAVYSLHGVEKNLIIRHPDCAHDFPDAEREAAYKAFDGVLKPN